MSAKQRNARLRRKQSKSIFFVLGERRRLLRELWCFECICRRCSDCSDFGTWSSHVSCPNCCCLKKGSCSDALYHQQSLLQSHFSKRNGKTYLMCQNSDECRFEARLPEEFSENIENSAMKLWRNQMDISISKILR